MSFWETMEMLSGENRRAKRAGLLAQQYTAPQLIEPDGPGLIGEPAAGIQPAGLMNPSQMQQYATGLIGIGGNPGQLGGALLQQQQAADLQQRQWMQQQLYNRQLNQQMGIPAGYSDLNQYGTALDREAKSYESTVKPYRIPLEYADRANDVVKLRGGVDNMLPPDDQNLVVAFQKMMKQNESVMGEDFTTTVNNRGGMDWVAGMYNKVMNGDALTGPQRQNIINLMNDIADWYKPEYAKRRTAAQKRAQRLRLPAGDYMPPQLDVKRPAAQFTTSGETATGGTPTGTPARGRPRLRRID